MKKEKNRLYSKVYNLFTEEVEKNDIYIVYLNDEEYKGQYRIKILAIYQAITLFLDINEDTGEYKIHKLFCQDAMDPEYARHDYPIEMLKENYTDLNDFIKNYIKLLKEVLNDN